MDLSGEVAKIHKMQRTLLQQQEQFIYLNKKETIDMVSMLRKEACSGSTHDLAHISTQNFLAECPTKASAKADNLITEVKTGKLLEVVIHPNFRTLLENEAFLSTWCRKFMHTREKDVFFLNTLKVCLAPTPQEGPFDVMFVKKQHTQEPQESKNYVLESEKKTFEKKWSRCFENNVCSRRHKHPVLQTSDIKFCRDPVCVAVPALSGYRTCQGSKRFHFPFGRFPTPVQT